MAEATGEHAHDAAEGSANLDAPRVPNPSRAAWTAYQDHRRGCSQCTHSVWRCAEGNELWNEYVRL